ncbi:FtsX-like permease family protein [Wenzhouxiangella sp. XN24]|uniref:ABC transporter permease n=1 Tax=Wenzhouxiangella sp. XN24 TaxID=2713569 RepID=UPI0013EB8917|nr:FtsX-like permease family protein [Wenzhouxiangella sp. XN24]NGX17413.1 FtsX-like permease family protein [Wenzhouxiangella sp. XN24]
MRALDRKLLRDVWHMRGMALAISLVLVGGVSTFVMARVTFESLTFTQARYYADQRFAEVFASLVRAPESVAGQLVELPGVNRMETRVVAPVNLEVTGFDDPVTGKIVSLPESGEPRLNVPYLRQGRLPAPRAEEEVAISEDFAEAHELGPGDRIVAIIKGRRKQLDIVGVALSPEYMYAIPPGAIFPDYERYGILWMNRKALATAYDMDGAFNDVSFTLQRGASARGLIDRVDNVLERYGGLGAYEREDQFSHRFITEELRGLQTMATIFPVIFLGVAAFLLNVVIGRLVATEREQIGTLKAFGYSTRQVGWHYTKLVLVVIVLGLLAGIAVGLWFARGLGGIYQVFYSFPYLHFRIDPAVLLQAVGVTLVAGLAGTAFAVRRAAALPPAEGMRPEPPPVYRATILERLGLQQRLAEPSRMIVRHIARKPLKAGLTVLGIAAAGGILMMTNFQRDAISWMVGVQYGLSSREDLTVIFTEPTSRRALYSLESLPGVSHAEGFRSVAARLVHGHRSYRTSVDGIEPGGELHRVLDTSLQPVPIPPVGVVLTEYLAEEILHIAPGDTLVIEVLEGARPVLHATVVSTTREYLGVNAYMSREALNDLMREGPAISGARLAVDAALEQGIYDRLGEMPRVAGTVIRDTSIEQFNEMMEETILYFSFITALLGGFIAFGVVYNSARIALSERGRELASLRVLGFTRGEVAYILLGEIGLLTLLSIPLGFVFGAALSGYLALSFSSDLYRIPLIIEPSTYALAAAIVLVSFVLSGLLIARKLAALDLVEVLKTRE